MKNLHKNNNICKIFCIILIIANFCYASVAFAIPKLKFKIYNLDRDLLTLTDSHLQLKAESIKFDDKIKDKIDDKQSNISHITQFYASIPEEVVKILQTQGYFDAKVTQNLAQPVEYAKDVWFQDFYVDKGLPVKIQNIDIKIIGDGKDDKKFMDKFVELPIKIDDTLRIDKYNATKKLLFDTAEQNGYVDANLIVKKIIVDKKAYTAKIILHLETGKQYFFGKTTFPQTFLHESFLKKFMPYKQGDVYSSQELQVLQDALGNSNFFRRVSVKPELTKTQKRHIPVKVVLLPRKEKQYSFGTGFGTDTGIRASFGLERRYLTKNGHSFKSIIQTSKVQNNAQVNYYIPGKNPLNDLYDISLAGQTLDIEKGKSFSTQIGLGYITNIGKWQQNLKIRSQYERYKLENEKHYKTSLLFVPSANWSYTKTDNFMKPSNGYRINLGVQGSHKYLLSSNSFLQTHLEAKYLTTFWQDFQIVLHGELGYTMIDDINNLPLSLQYYTGGTQTVRGYSFECIGPGKNLFVGSTELRYRIVNDWYIAGFFDAGEASSSFFTQPNKSLGVGVIWRTAIGALSLTYAKAITKNGQPSMIQFNLGPEL